MKNRPMELCLLPHLNACLDARKGPIGVRVFAEEKDASSSNEEVPQEGEDDDSEDSNALHAARLREIASKSQAFNKTIPKEHRE